MWRPPSLVPISLDSSSPLQHQMVRRNKAKGNALRHKAKGAAVAPKTLDGMELLNNEPDVAQVGGSQDIGPEVSTAEENANEQTLAVIGTDSLKSQEHGKEEIVNEPCVVDDFENSVMDVMNLDPYDHKVGIHTEIELETLIDVDKWLVTPVEENEVKALAEENVVSGCLGKGNATVIVGDDVGEITKENTMFVENLANKNEEWMEKELEEEEEKEYEEQQQEENVQSDEVDEGEDMVDDEVDGEDTVDDEVDDIHVEDKKILDKNGNEADVIGDGNCQGIAKEQHLEEEESTAKDGENNVTNEVGETPLIVDSEGKTADGNDDKTAAAGKVNCEGVVKELQEEEGGEVKNQKVIRSRKRIKTSTIMARLAGKKKLLQGVDEDLKEQKIGEEGGRSIDNDKNNVAYGHKGKEKVVVYLKDSGREKTQLNRKKEVGESSKKKRKRLKQKSRWDSLEEGFLVKVASESEGKSGLSGKKNGLLKAATKGMIFMCSSKTKQDCYHYMVLGLPAGKRELVQKIYKGMILFLYDVDKKLLNGIYKAAANGGYDLEPKAFNSKFPAQVRFEILEGCLPLEEEKFREVIRDNYYTRSKFDCQLNSGQVENLCELFRASIKDVESERKRSRRAVKSSIKLRQQEREKAQAKVKDAQAKFLAESHEVRRPSAREGRHHHKRPLVHNEGSSFPGRPVQLSQANPSSYSYERPLKRKAYRGEHHEIYREHQLLEPRDTYRRELLLDPYFEHPSTSRPERMLVPGNMYRVEQPSVQPRDSYRQYPVLERRDYHLKPLAEHRDFDLEPLAELPDSYLRQGLLLDHQDFYRNDPVLERQNRQQLDLEPRHSNIRGREDVLHPREDYSAYSGGVYSSVQQFDVEPRSVRREGADVLLSREDHSAYSVGLYSTARPLRPGMVPESHAVRLSTVYPSSQVESQYYSHRPVYRP